MNEHERDTEFLRQVILYDDTVERHKLDERITQVQRDERCVRRAVWLMTLLAALAAVGLGCSAVLLPDYPQDVARFFTQTIVKVFSALGLTSLISLLGFAGLAVVYRKELDRRREECRRFATKLLESRLRNSERTFAMSEHERDTEFLRQVILYDDTVEHHKLDERITQVERDERCVRRAVWLMTLLAALAVVGLSYSAVLLPDCPQDVARFFTRTIVKVFCVLGLTSLISLLGFAGLAVVYRKELDGRREECRRFATKLLESRLGKPRTKALLGVVKTSEVVLH